MAPAPRPTDRGRGAIPSGPIPLLFLIADTGGGHRTAAQAVIHALETTHPGQFAPALFDPLGGPESSPVLKFVTGLYGPSIRLAPWTWGAIYYSSDSRAAMAALRATILGLADRPVAEAVAARRPAAVVSFHPLLGKAAVAAARKGAAGTPVITVITDLVTPHTAWRYDKVDRIIAPSAAVRWQCHLDGIAPDRCPEIGLPVGPSFESGPLRAGERRSLRRTLGLSEHRFLAVLTGGGEGSGGLATRARALISNFDDVDVVAICGRNGRLEAKLRRLATRAGGRLVVRGFVDNMADWLRVADVVVTKAGPGTIGEATCCGAPLLLTSHVPGQEKGNTEFVVGAGAGREVTTIADLLTEVAALRADPSAVEAMRVASARLSRPQAARHVAALIASTVRGSGWPVVASGQPVSDATLA